MLGRFDSCFRTDISNFYPRIYTHSIPWALLGKEHSKAQMHSTTFKRHYANQLDIFVRNMQDKQRWSHFLRQAVKVDLPIQRTNHHEDAETVFG